jgi:hypothetical protein
MSKTKPKRKIRSNKFPLTLHKTGQYCKKIKGKIYYFGTDREQAHKNYLEQAVYLHTGKGVRNKEHTNWSLKALCNMYLDHQEYRATVGEIKLRYLNDQTLILRNFIKFIGVNRPASQVSTIDLQNYRNKLIKTNKTPNTINNHLSTIKAMYNWILENEIEMHIPNLKAVKKNICTKTRKTNFFCRSD